MAVNQSEHPAQLRGLLVVDKPHGWTSTEVVRQVRRMTGGAKAGHAGTLDPLATGIIIICLGKATAAVDRIMAMPKVYEAVIDLSAVTASHDLESPREEVAVAQVPDEAAVRAALLRFVGEIEQVPPVFSAMRIGGKRAYKFARKGQAVTMPPRRIRIDAIELLSYTWPRLAIRVRCGRGTYIRSLARDIGQALGAGGCLTELRRTAVGPYDLSVAVAAQRLTQPFTQADLLAEPGQ